MSASPILLVEDNRNDEELTLRAFRKSQVLNPVVVVRDGAEALDYLFARGAHADRNAAELPGLVLLDLKLPKVGGLEVLQAIRNHAPTHLLPVVILTSSVEEQDVAAGYGLGANSYVRKPVDYAQFVETVRQLGPYWMVINHAPPLPSA
jgi:two-component system, response regulator